MLKFLKKFKTKKRLKISTKDSIYIPKEYEAFIPNKFKNEMRLYTIKTDAQNIFGRNI